MIRKRFKYLMAATGLFLSLSAPAHAFSAESFGECMDVQKSLAQAAVVKNMTAAHQIIKQPSSVNALTCFDQRMMMSAKAGAIFSDTAPSSLPSFNGDIALGLGSAIGGPFGDGTTGTLLQDLTRVVDPVLNNLLGNFVGSLTSSIGSTLTSGLSSFASSLLGGTSLPGLGSVLSGIMGQQFDCSTIDDTWNNGVVGQGPDSGYSLVTTENIINGNLPADWATDALTQVLANQGILNDAQTVLENLDTPGFYSFNPVPVSYTHLTLLTKA